jgi:DnaJ-class molecular chaperone
VRDYYDLIGLRRDAGADEVRRACRRLAPVEPWDEDVAIDFPSTARVVDRIRASFFGEAASSGLIAEISISRDEAQAGADVPLLLPTRRVCPACGGRGEVWLDVCAPCAGSGEVVSPRQIRVSLPAGTEDGSHFRFALSSQGGSATSIEIRVAVR